MPEFRTTFDVGRLSPPESTSGMAGHLEPTLAALSTLGPISPHRETVFASPDHIRAVPIFPRQRLAIRYHQLGQQGCDLLGFAQTGHTLFQPVIAFLPRCRAVVLEVTRARKIDRCVHTHSPFRV